MTTYMKKSPVIANTRVAAIPYERRHMPLFSVQRERTRVFKSYFTEAKKIRLENYNDLHFEHSARASCSMPTARA